MVAQGSPRRRRVRKGMVVRGSISVCARGDCCTSREKESILSATLGLQSSSIGCDNMSIGSLIVGSFKEGRRRRAVISGGGNLAGSLMGVCENSVILGTLDEEGEDERQ